MGPPLQGGQTGAFLKLLSISTLQTRSKLAHFDPKQTLLIRNRFSAPFAPLEQIAGFHTLFLFNNEFRRISRIVRIITDFTNFAASEQLLGCVCLLL